MLCLWSFHVLWLVLRRLRTVIFVQNFVKFCVFVHEKHYIFEIRWLNFFPVNLFKFLVRHLFHCRFFPQPLTHSPVEIFSKFNIFFLQFNDSKQIKGIHLFINIFIEPGFPQIFIPKFPCIFVVAFDQQYLCYEFINQYFCFSIKQIYTLFLI